MNIVPSQRQKGVTWVMLIPLLTIYQILEFKVLTLIVLKYGFVPVFVYPQKTKVVLPRKSRMFFESVKNGNLILLKGEKIRIS